MFYPLGEEATRLGYCFDHWSGDTARREYGDLNMESNAVTLHRDRRLRLLLIFAAFAYATATLLYSILWMVDTRSRLMTRVELGFSNDFVKSESAYLVKSVYAGSPAERAGLLNGDRILAMNGIKIPGPEYLDFVWNQNNPGDTVHLLIARPGQREQMLVNAVFRLRQSMTGEGNLEHFANEIRNSFPIPFVLVGLTVLFLRIEDPMAWLLALLFGSFIAAPGPTNNFAVASPGLQVFAMGYRTILSSLIGPLFYFFFAVFPDRSPIDRRVPWLKWTAIFFGATFAISGIRVGEMWLPPPFHEMMGLSLSKKITFIYSFAFITLGLISLTINFVRAHTTEVRRKIRVILWGSGAAVVPVLIQSAVENFTGFQTPNWAATTMVLLLFLLPLSFAYAVVRHRVLEIPVLLKRSARYLMVQRGFTFLLSLASIGLILLFALSLAGYLQPIVQLTQPAAVALGSVFGTLLLWGGTQIHRRVSGRIDRAFFRNAYDARQILEDLAEKSALTTDRKELATLLNRNLIEALQPNRLIIYLRTAEGKFECISGDVPPALFALNPTQPLLDTLTSRGEPFDFPSALKGQANPFSNLEALQPECLVPLVARGKRLSGLLVLGLRRSEEPYSGEDKRLLSSIATQAAAALENIRLAEEIAQRIENEQRVAREMEISRRVLEADNARKTKELEEARLLQLSMLPVSLPAIPGLDIAVLMKTATEVGGDYYDFSVSDSGTLTVALGDATGHGLKAGTMVVAAKSLFNSFSHLSDLLEILENMTSNLKKLKMRSLYMSMLLCRVKGRTAFVASAGMPCPFVYRAATHQVEEIQLKGMPLGAFSDFPYEERTIDLSSGDTIVLMSDGLPEMFNENEEMLGSVRIEQLLKEIGHKKPQEIINSLAELGERWANGKPQQDDVTLLALRAKNPL